jgi:hypothetical protein
VGDHLFQSPICFYKSRGYDMAPGYEDNPAPGFSRPMTLECLQCHSGRPLPIANSVNRYATPAFAEEAISCDRCHGDATAHLKRPARGSIVNPRKLAPALRDSVCEQCHLAGVTRVLNPGKTFADFRPGQLLEEVFTTYVAAGPEAFKVVSHSEQLARSRCALESKGRMWCGTCHNPHAENVSYKSQCLSCHTKPFVAAHPARTSDCLPCHMPKREAEDGGHTAFTDHWIKRRPGGSTGGAQAGQLAAWREPRAEYRARNLALATGDYKLLLEAQKNFPTDPVVLAGLGTVLQNRGEAGAAARMFERAAELRPLDPLAAESAGMAWLAAGERELAARRLEKALELDPLLLPDIEALQKMYRENGDQEKEAALMKRVRQAMQTRQ